ncbi:uncharacterized protein LOC119453763 isoform X2 [Dermacentor silvarum]|uniref:uncharacterized protein LOC119453763 isoform X2 n=1 Tax=Dermacentor silvarum TaxID=543639 RepID=UPI002100FB07|nr:uncharacterized protein LOC119453763 isoform X2 [Dermacentor silvarum]
MEFHYNSFYFLYLWALFCHGKKHNVAQKPNTHSMENDVKTVLGSKYLIISRGVFTLENYPRCVISRAINVLAAGYHHNLSYYEKDLKMATELRKRVYLDAYYQVQQKNQMVLFVVNAHMGNHVQEPKISGSYYTLYANKGCFVAGTQLPGNTSNVVSNTFSSPKANAACFVWRVIKAKESHRAQCRAAFANFCRTYGGHKFVFTKEACLKKYSKNEPLPAIKQGLE